MKVVSTVSKMLDDSLLQKFQLVINALYRRFGWTKFGPATASKLASAAFAGAAGLLATSVNDSAIWIFIFCMTIFLWLQAKSVWHLMDILDAIIYKEASVITAYDDAATMNTTARLRSLFLLVLTITVVVVLTPSQEVPVGSALITAVFMFVCAVIANFCAEYILGCFTPLNRVVCVQR